jgi:hypothetical protein
MYSKEEEKNIRMAFWEGFRKYSTPKRRKQGKPRKWMMQNTGIKAIDLKFYIGSKQASVSLDVVAKSLDRRVAIWNKLLGLKRLLNEIFDQEVVWNDLFMLESGKEIIRIAVYLDDVNILDKESWDKVYEFFFKNMMKLEDWFEEYKDILKL